MIPLSDIPTRGTQKKIVGGEIVGPRGVDTLGGW